MILTKYLVKTGNSDGRKPMLLESYVLIISD